MKQMCNLVTCVFNWCRRVFNVWFVLRWPYAAKGTLKPYAAEGTLKPNAAEGSETLKPYVAEGTLKLYAAEGMLKAPTNIKLSPCRLSFF